MSTFELYIENYQKPLLLDLDCIWVAKYKWQFNSVQGAYTITDGKRVTLLSMLAPDKKNAYLTNGNPIDYRVQNIGQLEINQSQYLKVKKKMSSKYKGVSYRADRRKPWLAQKSCGGVRVLQKYFSTEIEAALAYNQATIDCVGHSKAFFGKQLNEFVH